MPKLSFDAKPVKSTGPVLEVDSRGFCHLEGEVTWIKKFSEDYTIVRITCDGYDDRTLTGMLPPVQIGERISVTAKRENHPKWGVQFRVQEFLKSSFASEEALIKYLSSKDFPDINKVLARRIVEHFGTGVLDILDADPSKVREVKGIGEIRENSIIDSYSKHREQHRAMAVLMGMGLPSTVAARSLQHFGSVSSAVAAITDNPYCLLEVSDVGWKTADETAQRMGIRANDDRRCAAALLHTADQGRNDGHCYVVYSALTENVQELTTHAFTQGQIMQQMRDLVDHAKLVREGEKVYPADLYYDETRAAKLLAEMLAYESLPIYDTEEEMLADLARVDGFKDIVFAEKQIKAIMYALNHRVTIITGPPGTGKTMTLKAITALYEKNYVEYKLCAPTGRASKRINEATGKVASTIHRLLGYDKETHGFQHKPGMPLKTDGAVCDETSMLDIKLMRFMLEAMERDDRLIFVGDHNQLPSVGPGNVLKDLIRSKQVPTVVLNHVFRQGEGSYIVDIAHAILRGEELDIPTPDKLSGRNCVFLPEDDADMIRQRLGKLITETLPSKGYPMADTIILTPKRKDSLGSQAINETLQEYINPPSALKKEVKGRHCVLREGDRVMMVRNNYNLGPQGVFNGDVGYLKQIVDEVALVKFPEYDDLIEFTRDDCDKLELAYCSTVHKAQGSEAKCVVLVMHPAYSVMLKRNLLYTAITRAREMCVVIGTRGAIAQAVSDNREFRRNTGLAQRLADELDLLIAR